VTLVKRVSLVRRTGRPRVSLTKTRVSLTKAPVRPPAVPRQRRRAVPTPTRVFAAASTGAVRGARATREWAGRPSGRMVLPGVLMALLVAVAILGGALLPHATGAEQAAGGPDQSDVPSAGPDVPLLPGENGENGQNGENKDPGQPLLPSNGPGPSGAAGAGGQAANTLAAWAAPMAVRTDIPLVALEAYAFAELKVAQTNPGCGLRWTTLAGIGRVESNHGRSNGATLSVDGRSSPPIYGPVLDGTGGTKPVRDTDQGRLDGDSTWDRAVGPMQFIPSTWATYAVDADGSGSPDPHDIDDAALAAGNYLCANGHNLATPDGWWDAIRKYNDVGIYAQNVFNAANDYGLRSRT